MIDMKALRKAIACLLAACVAAFWAPLCAGAQRRPLRLMVAADTHFRCAADLGEPGDEYAEYLLDDTFRYASTQGQMNYESEAILAELLAQFAASDASYLLIAGDLTCGKRASHTAFARYLREAELESGKKIFVTVGNHDCAAESGEDGISMEEFREIYADFGYGEALYRHDASASYAADLDEDYRLIAIDSCIYGEDEGRLSAVFPWLKEQAELARRDGKTPVVMMHHSLLPHYELQPMIDGWEIFAAWFADHGINTVLTGHIHANDISRAVSDRGNTVCDVQTGSLIASPNAYRLLTMETDAVEVETRYITKIDRSLLPGQLTEAQKAALADDFPAYAKAYFVSGVCKWLNRNVGSVNRIARWFKLKEGTEAYQTAETIMKRLGAAVGQDIYDTGEGASIEAALAPYNVAVPPSAYRKPYEVAAELIYGFFRGDEDAAGNRENERLLLACLEGALLTAIKESADDGSLRALVLAADAGQSCAGAICGLTPAVRARRLAEQMALALLETLAGGFTDDYSAPADLNVSLARNQSGADAAALHPLVRLLRLLAEFLKRAFAAFGAA